MYLICILMGLSSLALMVALVGSVLWGPREPSELGGSDGAPDGVDAGAARAAQ